MKLSVQQVVVFLPVREFENFSRLPALTSSVNYTERTMPVIAIVVLQATNSLLCTRYNKIDRLVLKGLILFVVLEKAVDGLTDSAFAIVYLLLPFPLFGSSCLSAHCAILEHEPLDVHCLFISFLSVTFVFR